MIKLANVLKISRKCLVPARVLLLPNFDFEQYMRIRNQNVCIISDTCWGGYTYHSLDMPFQSPFINMFLIGSEYKKLICNLQYYLAQPLEFVRHDVEIQNNLSTTYPVCRLGDVEIHCNHYHSYENAKEIWDKRVKRFDFQNIFIKMNIEEESELEIFSEIPYKKIGFSSIPSKGCSDVIDLSGEVMSSYIKRNYQGVWSYINTQADVYHAELKHYNIIKLLLGEKDYRRTVL